MAGVKAFLTNRKRRLPRLVLGAILLVALSSLATYSLLGADLPGHGSADPRVAKLWSIIRLVQQQYVEGPPDLEQLFEGAYEGVVRALGDLHSNYLSKQAYQEWTIGISGEYFGVGMTIVQDENGAVRVVRPFRGSPAEKAGLRSGDRIIRVDDRDVSGLTADDVANLVRGLAGTKVRLVVERDVDGVTRALQYELVRTDIQVPAVEGIALLPGGIGYVQLVNFNQNAYEQTREALQSLARQGMKGLILDLRHNGGGALDQAVEVAGLFVPPRQLVVSVVSRDGVKEEYRSPGPGWGKPLAVLVDGYTASASEIVAGAIRDYGLGTLVGTKTFGKGSVQKLFPLPDGSGVRVTVAKYYTPKGVSINKVGLTPDVEVTLPPGKLPIPPVGGNEIDTQVAKALELLRGRLPG